MSKNILIYDDDPDTVERWSRMVKRVARDFKAVSVEKEGFGNAVIQLEQRRGDARTGTATKLPWGKHPFDNAAILIIDYDLLNPKDWIDSDKQMYLTGEEIAYLARCYSRCGLIVALNQYGVNSFDLTLKGHPESYADLNLGAEQLDNQGLWGEPWTGFRPWSWPLLPHAVDAFEQRVKELAGHLDDPILSFLGFPEETAKILPRSAAEFIQGEKPSEKTTFRDFVRKSGNGLRRKDEPLDDESVMRIAAARVTKWLERLVLPGQDILVDVPHLISRYPSLLKGDKEDIESWNKAASFKAVSKLGIRYDRLNEFNFKKNWLSRPAWFWRGISNAKQIAEVADPWRATDRPDFVFCEDISRFLLRNAAREFVADVFSPFVHRFVVDPASKGGRRFAKVIDRVDYRPQVRFSL